MNQQAVNEAISSWFEPKPPQPDYTPEQREQFGIIYNRSGMYATKKGAWVRSEGNWPCPLDYLTDESANARLLEAMRKTHLVVVVLGHELNYCAVVWIPAIAAPFSVAEFINYPSYFDHADRVMAKDRKTAVVLAFCKFAGIEPK